METDRELLELAAKAVGLIIIDPDLLVDGKFMVRHISDGRLDRWNARDDDGDALRLAVAINQLNLLLLLDLYGDAALYRADPTAATRRAIVRSAAAMPEGGQG